MDFNVKDFNVRLRTINLLEAAIAIIVCIFLAGYIYTGIGFENEEFFTMIFDLLIMLFFAIASLGTRGFSKDIDKVFEFGNLLKIFGLSILYFLFCGILMGFCSSIGLVFSIKMPCFLMSVGSEMGDPVSLFLGFIVAVFIAPISEELLFRGVLFNRLKIRMGASYGMIISSIIFGSLHFYGGTPLLHVITATVFGMLMCVFFMKYDNILMNITVHFLGNLLVYLGNFGLLGYLFGLDSLALVIGALCLISIFFVPIYIIYYARKFNR